MTDMYKSIIFDLDGTLVNTKNGILNSINFVLNEMGLDLISKDNQKSFIGPPIYKSLQKFYGLNRKRALEGHARFREVYEEKYLYDAFLYSNIPAVLRELYSKNYELSVATYKKEDHAISLLKYFSIYQYFNIVKGSNDDNSFTKTDIVSDCITKLNIHNKSDIILIGDSYSDLEAANNNNVDFLGVTYGFGFSKEYYNIENMNYVETPIEILKYILVD